MASHDVDRSSGPRTVLVTQWFLPEPVRIPLSIAESLHERGHRVDVLTGIPNFPNGKVIGRYKAWLRYSERISNFGVTRTPLYPSHDSSSLKRIANYMSWAISSSLLGGRLLRRADAALIYSSPATAALAPAVWRKLGGAPFVLIIEDLWPDSVFASGMLPTSQLAKMGLRVLDRFVNWTYRSASHIVTISPGMAEVLHKRGVSHDKITLIYNWAAESKSSGQPERRSSRRGLGIPESAFVVSYSGTQGPAQGLHEVVNAAAMLADDEDILFLIAGDGIRAKSLIAQAASLNCHNVRFLGQVPQHSMPSIRAASDLELVSLIDNPLFSVTMPSKVQSILESGSPLALMAAGDAANVVAQAGAGWVVPPGNAVALAQSVRQAKSIGSRALGEMGKAGRDYYYQFMCQSIGAGRLDEIVRKASRTSHQSRRSGRET